MENNFQDSGNVAASGVARPYVQHAKKDEPVQQHESEVDATEAEAATAAQLSGTSATATSQKRTATAMEESAMDTTALELPGTSTTGKSRKRTADEMEETGGRCRKRNASDLKESQSLEPAQKRMRTSALSGIGSSLRGIVKVLRCPHRSEPATKQAVHR